MLERGFQMSNYSVKQLIDALQKIEDKSLEVRIELPWADDNLYVYHTFEHSTGENGYEDKGEVVLYTETEVDHG